MGFGEEIKLLPLAQAAGEQSSETQLPTVMTRQHRGAASFQRPALSVKSWRPIHLKVVAVSWNPTCRAASACLKTKLRSKAAECNKSAAIPTRPKRNR